MQEEIAVFPVRRTPRCLRRAQAAKVGGHRDCCIGCGRGCSCCCCRGPIAGRRTSSVASDDAARASFAVIFCPDPTFLDEIGDTMHLTGRPRHSTNSTAKTTTTTTTATTVTTTNRATPAPFFRRPGGVVFSHESARSERRGAELLSHHLIPEQTGSRRKGSVGRGTKGREGG